MTNNPEMPGKHLERLEEGKSADLTPLLKENEKRDQTALIDFNKEAKLAMEKANERDAKPEISDVS